MSVAHRLRIVVREPRKACDVFSDDWIADRVAPCPMTGCWLWTLSTRQGYGQFHLGPRIVDAHRAFYAHFRGPIPDGMFVCHSCDVRACVNPDHLFIGTPLDNMRDMDRKGRRVVSTAQPKTRGDSHWTRRRPEILRTGESSKSSKLTIEDAREILRLSYSALGTQREIAAKFSVTQSVVSNIRNGRRWPDVEAERNKWREFESRKREIGETARSSQEYERRIRELAERLGV